MNTSHTHSSRRCRSRLRSGAHLHCESARSISGTPADSAFLWPAPGSAGDGEGSGERKDEFWMLLDCWSPHRETEERGGTEGLVQTLRRPRALRSRNAQNAQWNLGDGMRRSMGWLLRGWGVSRSRAFLYLLHSARQKWQRNTTDKLHCSCNSSHSPKWAHSPRDKPMEEFGSFISIYQFLPPPTIYLEAASSVTLQQGHSAH